MNLLKRNILMNAFFDSQFKYCPPKRMLHCCTNKRKTGRLYQRCLRIIDNDKQSSFKELLEKDSSVSIHERIIQILTTEMYNLSDKFSPPNTNEIFEVRTEHSCNLRQNSQLFLPLLKSVYHGNESISFLGPKFWNTLPSVDKIQMFNTNLKRLSINGNLRIGRIFKKYITNVGFIYKTMLDYFWLNIDYYICVCICMFVCVYMNEYVFMHVCVYLCMCMCLGGCQCVCVCVSVLFESFQLFFIFRQFT